MADPLIDAIDGITGVPVDPLTKAIDDAVAAPPPVAQPAPAFDPFKAIEDATKLTPGPAVKQPQDDPVLRAIDDATAPVTALPQLPEHLQPTDTERVGLGDAFTASVQRGVNQFRSALPTIQGVYSEWTGDTEGAARYAAEAKKIEEESAKPVVGGFSNIKNAEDTLYWMVEEFGAQLPVLGATMAGAMIGGRFLGPPAALGAAGVRMGLFSTQAAAKLSPTLGAIFGGSLVGVPLELADTASELRDATGSYHPGLSTGAGMFKGLLEVATPLGVINRLTGRTVGSTFGRTATRTALTEGFTELAQEEVNIAARKYADPDYSYFGEEALFRRLDSFASGTFIGGGVGVPTEAAGRALDRRRPQQQDPAREENVRYPSPVSFLKRQLPFLQTERDTSLVKAHKDNPFLDPLEANILLDTFGDKWAGGGIRLGNEEAFYDWMERNTTRYALVDENSKTRVMWNPTDLERQLGRYPIDTDPKKRFVEIDQQTLTPAGVTAMFDDLPMDTRSFNRVFFLPHVSPELKKALTRDFWELVNDPGFIVERDNYKESGQVNPAMMQQYERLLNAGLRVLPSAGASFNYAGEFSGKEVDKVPKSGRSHATYMPNTKDVLRIQPPTDQREQIYAKDVSLDIYRLRPGETLSLNYTRFDKTWTWPAAITAEEQKNTLDEIARVGYGSPEGQAIMQNLLDRGVTDNPVVDADFIYVNKNLDVGRAQLVSSSLESYKWYKGQYPAQATKDTYIKNGGVVVDNFIPAPYNTNADILSWQKEAKAIIEKINTWLMGKGYEPILYLHIKDDVLMADFTNGQMRGTDGTLFIMPSLKQTKLDWTYILWHEIGHWVTLSALNSKSVSEYDALYQSYRRNVLADTLTDPALAARMQSEIQGAQIMKPYGELKYVYNFAEYLTEQFVRWVASTGNAETSNTRFFKEFGNEFKELYEALLDRNMKYNDPVPFPDRVRPDYEFVKTMELLLQMEEDTLPMKQGMGTGKELLSLWTKEDNVRSILNELQELSSSPVVEDFDAAIEKAKNEIAHLLPEGWNIVGNPNFDDSYAVPGRREIIIGMGALRMDVGVTMFHELIHALRSEQLFTTTEWESLVAEATRDKRLMQVIKAEYTQHYTKMAEKYKADLPYSPDSFVADFVQDKLNEEAVAFMTSVRLAGGSYSPATNTLLDRIIAFLRQVKKLLVGESYVSPADVRRRIFSGEITARETRDTAFTVRMDQILPTLSRGTDRANMLDPQAVVQVAPDMYVAYRVDSDNATFRMYKPPAGVLTGNPQQQHLQLGDDIGAVYLSKNKKGWEVDYVKVWKTAYSPGVQRSEGFAATTYRFVEKTLGQPMRPSAILLSDGYKMWMKRDPQAVRYHVLDKTEATWYSPNYIRNQLLYWDSVNRRENNTPQFTKRAKEELTKFKQLYKAVPRTAWRDPELERMFQLDLKQYIYGTGLAMRTQNQAYMERYITEEDVASDGMAEKLEQKRIDSQLKNAKIGDLSYKMSAPDQHEFMPMKNLLRSPKLSAADKRALSGVFVEADRLGWFSKKWWGINQMMWANPHFAEGQEYLRKIDQWVNMRAQWVSRADETAQKWNKLPAKQRDGLAKLLFWMTDMGYLSAQERIQKVVRQPTLAETAQAYVSFSLDVDTQNLHKEIDQSFYDFLSTFEEVSRAAIEREFIANPTGKQAALLELANDIAAMRQKPYFPMSRFGEWALTVRDPVNNKVLAFYTFESQKEQHAYISIARSRWPGKDLKIGRIPTAMQDYMTLPGAVLKRIKGSLPGITPLQRDWIDQLEHQTAPERSFRKHWLKRESTDGFSLDALRVYSNYFNVGAGYLARLRYKDEAQDVIGRATQNAKTILGDSNKRFELIDEMQLHLNYMLEPGRDGSKLRAFAAIWYLGFSPAAAAMNLTQIPVHTIPYLSSMFEGSAVKRAVINSISALKGSFGGIQKNPKWAGYEKARQEMIREGRIDAGQAPELGAFASMDNLMRTAAGDAAQRFMRGFSSKAMWMFGKTERFNRELTFAMTFDLAMTMLEAGKTNKYLTNITVNNTSEIFDLVSRARLSQNEAVAFLAAREAIDRTQFVYAPWARPRMMRNPLVADVLVFFQFIQSSLFALRHNPGNVKTLLTMLALYGLMGMPFSNDLDKVVEAIARRFFGKDFSPQFEARKLINSIAKGTVMEKIAPDLLLHGTSRFGFGIGLLPDSWGAPKFDASANGSMGNIVPVLPDLVKGWGHYGKWNEIVGQGAQKAAGAGYGYFFSLLQFLSQDPHTAGYKKWEAILPRAVKAASKAGRYAATGEEVSNSGAKIANFNVPTAPNYDIRDPSDTATVLAQLFGFTPQKLAQHWEVLTAQKESEMFYKGLRMTLYKQMDEAVRVNNAKAIDDVVKAIVRFNVDAERDGLGSLAMNPTQILSSLKNRAKNRAREEMGIPQTKSSIPLYRQIEEQYPLLERKKVK